MTEAAEQILEELRETNRLLDEVLQSIKDLRETVGGWMTYPYLEEVRGEVRVGS